MNTIKLIRETVRMYLREMSERNVEWTLPSYEDEWEEFDRYGFSQEELNTIQEQFTQENLIVLTGDIWSRLGNTDSYDVKDEDEVMGLADEYGKDWESIKSGLEGGGQMDAPIVLLQDGRYELVAGNTRLMLCKVLGITPQVLLVEL